MQATDITVEVRDSTRQRVGQVRPEDLDLTVTDALNGVGTWRLTLPIEHPMTPVLRTPGSGIIITGPGGQTMLSGPVVTPESAVTSDDPIGIITFDGVSDAVHLADRLAVPNPAYAELDAEGDLYDVRTGTVEDLMYAYVAENLGPSAPSARRVPGLALGTSAGRGPTVTRRVRYERVGEVLESLARGTGLYWTVRQVGTDLLFEVHESTDRRDLIRLDVLNGTLAGHRVATSPPGATRVLVAGKIDDLPDDSSNEPRRVLREVSTVDSEAAEAAWGRRIERFVDQRAIDDEDELVRAGVEVLAEEGFSAVSVQIVPMDDTSMVYGRDWGFGDLVTVVVEGQELTSTVTGYVLKAGSQGTSIGVVLGDAAGFDPGAALRKRVAGVESRVSQLERNAEASATGGGGAVPLDPADYDQATPPQSYPRGESLLHLSYAQTSAGGWDFDGISESGGTVRTINAAGTGDAIQVWQSHDGNLAEPVRWIRSGNASDGWSPWRQLITEADFAAWQDERHLPLDWFEESYEPDWYAEGTSLMPVQPSGGWTPNGGSGLVVTHHWSLDYAAQAFHARSGSPRMWLRNHSAANPGWSAWEPVAMASDLREEVVTSGPLSAGTWYRIAEFTGVEANLDAKASAEFVLTTAAPGLHNLVRLRASVALASTAATLTVEECVGQGTTPLISRARIVSLDGTYGGHALEIYCQTTVPAGGSVRLHVRHDDWVGGRRWGSLGFAVASATPPSPQAVLLSRGVGYMGSVIVPTLLNGWTDYGSGYSPVGYRMLPGGMVELQGLVTGGVVSSTSPAGAIFRLPEGYRPPQRLLFPSTSSSATYPIGRIDVLTDGYVLAHTGSNGFMSLAAIKFVPTQ